MKKLVLTALFSVLVTGWTPTPAHAQFPTLDDQSLGGGGTDANSERPSWLTSLFGEVETQACFAPEPVVNMVTMAKALDCGSCPNCASSSGCDGKKVGVACSVGSLSGTCKAYGTACCSWLFTNWRTCCTCG